MKVPLNWIAEFVDIHDLSHSQIAEKLVFSGTEVESVLKVGEFAHQYRVVEVIDVSKREGIRLPVCTIYDGQSKYQVLTGASNIKKGKFIWCPPNSKVKKGAEFVEIGIKKVKDISSYGMLLSPAEIGFPDSEEDKLLEIPDYVDVGKKASEIFKLPDYVLDVSVTPQRGDLLSVLGLSIELSAVLGRSIKFETERIWSAEASIYQELLSKTTDEFDILVENSEVCKVYFGGLFIGKLRNNASDPIIISRLYLCGSRPINPIVDATNYILFEVGQPTHAFDFDKISGEKPKKVVVRNSKKGEKILCLDGKERELSDQDLVIADSNYPIAIAGVIGGEKTAVSSHTTKILLESAFFTPANVRRTSKRLGVDTESSYRFSRRVSPSGVILAAQRIKSILEKEGFEFVGARLYEKYAEFQNKTIEFPFEFLSQYTGVELQRKDIISILDRLGIKTSERDGKIICRVPIWRGDLNIKEDIVEEVIRILGYDKISGTIPKFPGRYDEDQSSVEMREFVEKIRDKMASIGYIEVKTYPFSKNEGIAIKNPISEDFAFVSDRLDYRILEVIIDSIRKGMKNIRIFEIEKDFSENWILAFGIYGYSFPQKWSFPKDKKADVFDLKEVFEVIIPYDINFSDQYVKETNGIRSDVFVKDTKVGEIFVSSFKDIPDNIFVGKINLNIASQITEKFGRFHSELPLIERDISFYIKDDTRWSDIKKIFFISENVVDVYVFDVWEKDGRKSITARLVINQGDRTMTSEDINSILNNIISELTKAGFEVRALQI